MRMLFSALMIAGLVLTSGFCFPAPPALAQQSLIGKSFPKGARYAKPEELQGMRRAQLTRAYVPEAIDLSDRVPKPRQQLHGSCVSWAVGYAARGYYEFANRALAPNDENLIPSPSYIHSQIFAEEGLRENMPPQQSLDVCKNGGASIPSALELLKKSGAKSLREEPVKYTCQIPGRKVQLRQFRIADIEYLAYKVKPEYRHRSKDKPVDIGLFKQKLASGHPVIFSMQVGRSMELLPPGETYKGPKYSPAKEKLEGHAMTLVGYDERRNAFRLQNSWGDDWSDNGYGWIDFQAFRSLVSEAYAIIPMKKPPSPSTRRPTTQVSALNLVDEFRKLNCAQLEIKRNDLSGKTFKAVYGFVERDEDLDVVDSYAKKKGFVPSVDVRPWPICEALKRLHVPLRAPSLPKVEMVPARTTLKVGQNFGFRITSPDFPSYIYVLYLQRDGQVVNLLPRSGPLRPQTPPGTELRFGTDPDDKPLFEVTRPLGDELLMVLAARSPLEEIEKYESGEDGLYRVAGAVEGDAAPQDRILLSILGQELVKRPNLQRLQREVAAAVVHLKIEE